jgi:hypothetical protein
MSSTLGNAFLDYPNEDGKIISLQATVVHKYPVAQEIEIRSDEPSTFLSLDAPGTDITAALLVVGSPMDALAEGSRISFRCIPFYCFAPEGGGGGLFFITLPELINKS